MKINELFSDKIAVKIWDQYFRRVNRFSRILDKDQQKELQLEIQDHLYESFNQETGDSEAVRLLNAIDKIGDPEEYIKPMVAYMLLSSASRTLNPKTIIKGLYYNIFEGIKHLFVSLFYVVGYLTAITFGSMAILKLFFPKNVGFFIYKSGGYAFGVIGDPINVRTEILGYWIIPIGIVLSLLLYFSLTRSLRVLKTSKKD
jgi:hypothetical protein